jgi:hypothetical protein
MPRNYIADRRTNMATSCMCHKYVVAMLVKQPKKGSFSQDEGAISAHVMPYIDYRVQMWRLM